MIKVKIVDIILHKLFEIPKVIVHGGLHRKNELLCDQMVLKKYLELFTMPIGVKSRENVLGAMTQNLKAMSKSKF